MGCPASAWLTPEPPQYGLQKVRTQRIRPDTTMSFGQLGDSCL